MKNNVVSAGHHNFKSTVSGCNQHTGHTGDLNNGPVWYSDMSVACYGCPLRWLSKPLEEIMSISNQGLSYALNTFTFFIHSFP